MAHTYMGHGAHIHESCHTHMSHVTHAYASCHSHTWVTSHTFMSHVKHIHGLWHTYVSHDTHRHESWHTQTWVMSHRPHHCPCHRGYTQLGPRRPWRGTCPCQHTTGTWPATYTRDVTGPCQHTAWGTTSWMWVYVRIQEARDVRVMALEFCAAVCCSVLQCVAVCCSVLQCVAMCCNVLQCAAMCCSVL